MPSWVVLYKSEIYDVKSAQGSFLNFHLINGQVEVTFSGNCLSEVSNLSDSLKEVVQTISRFLKDHNFMRQKSSGFLLAFIECAI